MTRETLVFIIGFVVLMSPFIGVPREQKEWGIIVCGALLMVLGYGLRRKAFLHSIEHESGERRGDAFVESVRAENGKTDFASGDRA